jgi:hypothetical protein
LIVRVGRGLFIRVLQIAERVRVDLISSGHLLCFEFHLNLAFTFKKSLWEVRRC